MRGATACGTAYSIVDAEFQSALPMRGATRRSGHLPVVQGISIRAPHAGSDVDSVERDMLRIEISIRAPHAGSDCTGLEGWRGLPDFNPRSPCGERRLTEMAHSPAHGYFNPRSPCGERPRHLLLCR